MHHKKELLRSLWVVTGILSKSNPETPGALHPEHTLLKPRDASVHTQIFPWLVQGLQEREFESLKLQNLFISSPAP